MKDLYSVLGVSKTATADEIKKAYRKLASKHHPDKGGDTAVFQAIQTAYDTLGDPQKRQQYDNPPQFNNFHRQNFNDPFQGGQFDLHSIFDMFGAQFHQSRPQVARVGLTVTLEDVYNGGKKTIALGTMHGQHAVEIEIPKGVENGMSVHYSKIAPGGMDLVIQYRIEPHSVWSREGSTLIVERNLSIWELIVGTSFSLTTISGQTINLKVPDHTQPGTILRLRGMGLPSVRGGGVGDALVKINGEIPENIPEELLELVKKQVQ